MNSFGVTLARVPENDRPHIFAPFYRGQIEQSGDRGGAGLGLAITREIARSSGGDLYLDESYTGGARFVLDLKCRLPRPPAPPCAINTL